MRHLLFSSFSNALFPPPLPLLPEMMITPPPLRCSTATRSSTPAFFVSFAARGNLLPSAQLDLAKSRYRPRISGGPVRAAPGEEPRARAVSAKSEMVNGCCDSSSSVVGTTNLVRSMIGKSSNIVWHECTVGKLERQKLLNQKGCVIWITGLSGSGKSTLSCALSRELHHRGHLVYAIDGDNIRHGLNHDLSFRAEDRAENIRRIGQVAKLFADAGVICIASLISPFQRDRDSCRALLPDSSFIEVFMDFPLEVCEVRDPKGLYKLARAGKIKGFTGIDDPYEPPLDCEIKIQQKGGKCPTPLSMAEQVINYLENNGFLHA